MGHPKVDRSGLTLEYYIDLGEFLFGADDADTQSLNFADPAFTFGFGDPVAKVVSDLAWSKEFRG
ncbi:hypothetical protein ACWCXK_39045 [Streptomyces sp. NPDC001739]